MKAPTIKQRLTLWFAVAFLVSGVIVQAIVAWRLDRRLRSDFDGSNLESLGIELPEGLEDRGPPAIVLPDGRSLADIVVEAQEQFRIDTLAELTLWSGVSIAITGVLAILIGRWLAERALRPIEGITETAKRITASSLDTRLSWDGPDDEVRDLASTIDHMLQRIEDGISAQRQFAAMASHELLTPLAGIELEADLARSDPTSTTVVELADRTLRGSRRASELVAKLLELARGQAGPIERSPLELWEVVNSALDPQLDRANEREVRVDFVPGSGQVIGDRTLLTSMVANLIQNAIRHNVAGGEVTVTVAQRAHRVDLIVENSGPVVDGHTLERINKPFQRGVDNPQDLGHGIGLSIVRTIVDHHDATLQLTPRPAGGMRVDVSFPTR